jgi:hypothetical protein
VESSLEEMKGLFVNIAEKGQTIKFLFIAAAAAQTCVIPCIIVSFLFDNPT